MAWSKAERLGLWAVAVGALAMCVGPAWMDISYDGNAYVATGHGWQRTGELRLAWGDPLTWWPVDGDTELAGYSHHFPPAYPVYLGAWFEAFGYGPAQAKLAGIAMGLAMLGTVYACTRDLYGRTPAAAVTGTLAVSPFVLWVAGMGFSENLGILLFSVTMWGILRSLRQEWYIVPAGIAAGLAYLSRSSMGAFFLIAGAGGFAWRLWHRGVRRTVTSLPYAAAIAAFGSIVALWANRNVQLFDAWDLQEILRGKLPYWETSPGVKHMAGYILRTDEVRSAFLEGLWVRLPLLLAPIALPLALLWPQARASLRCIREEHTSGLWLSVALLLVLSLVFAAAFYSFSPSRHERFRLDNARYMLVAIVPVLWALARESDFDDPAVLRRWAYLGAVSLVACGAVLAYPAHQLPGQAARELDPYLAAGDGIEVGGFGKYAFYSTLTHPQDVDVWVEGHGGGRAAEFLVFGYRRDHPGYTLLASKSEDHPWWPQQAEVVEVWVRDDVQAQRNVTLGTLHAGW